MVRRPQPYQPAWMCCYSVWLTAPTLHPDPFCTGFHRAWCHVRPCDLWNALPGLPYLGLLLVFGHGENRGWEGRDLGLYSPPLSWYIGTMPSSTSPGCWVILPLWDHFLLDSTITIPRCSSGFFRPLVATLPIIASFWVSFYPFFLLKLFKIEFHILKCINSAAFSALTVLCKHYPSLVLKLFHHPRTTLCTH